MIWVNGRIVADDGLAIPATDRTFEHGLGLFETFRTWNGRPVLLDGHRDRMLNSAKTLRLPIDTAHLPDAEAVGQLLDAEGIEGDRMLRITATGGTISTKSIVWMKAAPLPPLIPPSGAVVMLTSWMVARDEPMARFKTLNYWSRRLAYDRARDLGYDEILATTPDWIYWEGSRTNLFVIQKDRLLTPSLEGPIVPGVMRGLVLAEAGTLSLGVREVHGIESRTLLQADEVFLTNAVRGIIPVAQGFIPVSPRVDPARFKWEAPGPWTRAIQARIAGRLERGEPI